MKHYIQHHKDKKNGKPRKPSDPPPFDVLMRRFKKKCERDGIVAEVRERQYKKSIQDDKNNQKGKEKLK